MEKKNQQHKGTSFFSSLLIGLAGIGIGLGAKYVADEYVFNSENKETEKEKKPEQSGKKEDNKYEDINQTIENAKTINTENCIEEYESFLCPISQEIMTDPIITPRGITYDRKSILNWLKKSNICPITKSPLNDKDLISNYSLKNAISEYLKKQDFKNQ